MTDFLFAKPSVISGIATCVDLYGIYHAYNKTKNPDDVALLMDWITISRDFKNAFNEVVNEQKQQTVA